MIVFGLRHGVLAVGLVFTALGLVLNRTLGRRPTA